MTMPARRALVAALLGGAVLAACGGPGSPPSRAGGATTSSTAGTAGATGSRATTSTTSTTVAGGAGEWTTYGGNEARSAVQPLSPPLYPLHHLWTSPALDGQVYGEPLIWHGTVFAATENDTVYALSARTGSVEWSRHLATPAPAGALPCGDIGPTVGITSTMVLDPARALLFASAETASGSGTGHELAALDPATGAVRWTRDLGSAGPAGASQLQRAGLGLDAGRVLVGFGGNYGDCGSYHGWLLGVPEAGSGPIDAYQVPTRNEGAVWAPAGVAVDPAGHVYLATGNGSARPGEGYDHGNSVVELSPALEELGYFAPSDWARDNASDGDLGSTAPVLLTSRGRGYVFQVGKENEGYLLAQGGLGGIGGQVSQTAVCLAMGGDAWLPPDIYVGCPQAGVTAVRVGAGGSLSVAWTTPGGAGGPPTVAGGLVWSVNAGAGTLDGLSPGSGTVVDSVPVIATEHFAALAAGEGLLVLGGAGAVEAFAGPSGWVG